MDPALRILKAQKILRLLSSFRSLESSRILEIGCGSGHISSWIAKEVRGARIFATDIEDVRTAKEGYEFRLSQADRLEFAEASFDVVISNHVIEHVGERSMQATHLAEIARVMRPSGLAYLATPNRWRFMEAHYELPLLSWFPQSIADSYVRLTRRGSWYDVTPLSSRQLAQMFTRAGLVAHPMMLEAIRATGDIESDSLLRRLAKAAPTTLLRIGMPIVPSLVYVLEAGHARVD